MRVSGDARACRSVVTGSGFVIAPDRVMTNAHVVAGVDAPVVRAPGELPVTGRVVYVDERQDLAVVATDGLDAPALSLRTGARSGDVAVVAGYLHGVRQLQLEAAQVVGQRSTIVTTDGQSRLRRVLTLASDIEQGNSGARSSAPTGTSSASSSPRRSRSTGWRTRCRRRSPRRSSSARRG